MLITYYCYHGLIVVYPDVSFVLFQMDLFYCSQVEECLNDPVARLAYCPDSNDKCSKYVFE